ncbi:hypothetical protein L596_024873 [Steinernema carpocapsae]|uniref:Uncharacterized protein n=1 Tax=Steinernema carpocapsae TaxID=34508 RepID=A0A4U5M643_STECR|nr:hypothetical protein L596_024873 [Steinernema carpocapsae]
MENVERAHQRNRFRIVRRPESKEVVNLKRVILYIGALTQAISFILGCYYMMLHLFEASESAKCYVFEKLGECHPIEYGYKEYVISIVDYVVFFLCPAAYLIGMGLTVTDHRNPAGAALRLWRSYYTLMYPALLPSIYYFLASVFWHCSTLDRILQHHAPSAFWTQVLSSSLGLLLMFYLLITQMLSLQLCHNFYKETEAFINYASEVRRMIPAMPHGL